MTDGETGVGELRLFEEGEEVGLVFVGVRAFDQGKTLIRQLLTLGIVAGCDGIKPVVAGVVEKDPKLNIAITHHVGVGGETSFIAVEKVGDDSVSVIFHEVDDAKRDSEMLGYGSGVDNVLCPRTVPDDFVFVDPILHVGGLDLDAGIAHQHRGDGAINAAGECDKSAWS